MSGLRAFEERQPEVSTAYRTGRAKGIANIGSVLYEKALSGDIKAAQFYLKTQAGWTEKNYIELSKAEEPEDRHWTVELASHKEYIQRQFVSDRLNRC